MNFLLTVVYSHVEKPQHMWGIMHSCRKDKARLLVDFHKFNSQLNLLSTKHNPLQLLFHLLTLNTSPWQPFLCSCFTASIFSFHKFCIHIETVISLSHFCNITNSQFTSNSITSTNN
uniref:Uncharacterized protein n=1 Tax=Spongospora subterranea TaxID=70186 RepID=A0A0H5QWQ3_9EUKA|eukprot:CRZ06340.1 hypothetical protein [Spongospora subterranea]